MDDIRYLIENFDGKVYNLCFEILESGNNPAEAFEYTCKNLFTVPQNGSIVIREYFTQEEIDEYDTVYGDTIKGFLCMNIRKCDLGIVEENDFYKSLWKTFCAVFTTQKELAFAFFCAVTSQSIPYQHTGKPLLMSDRRFQELTEKNMLSIQKIIYIKSTHYEQRTSQASLLLECLNEIEDYDSKVVVLAHAISIFGKEYDMDGGNLKALMRQISEEMGQLGDVEF